MGRVVSVVWEPDDLDRTYGFHSDYAIRKLKAITFEFCKNYKNIEKFNKTVYEYNVEFITEIINDDTTESNNIKHNDNNSQEASLLPTTSDSEKENTITNEAVVVIKFKTSYMSNFKEFFRFLKNDKTQLDYLHAIKIKYSSFHILENYFLLHQKELFPNYIPWSNDPDPDDIFNFKKNPEFLNGGFDYFTGTLNEEIVSEKYLLDINYNLRLTRDDCIPHDHPKIIKLQNRITDFFSSMNTDVLSAAYGAFINDVLAHRKFDFIPNKYYSETGEQLKKYYWVKWKNKFDVYLHGPTLASWTNNEGKVIKYHRLYVQTKNIDGTTTGFYMHYCVGENYVSTTGYCQEKLTGYYNSLQNEELKQAIVFEYLRTISRGLSYRSYFYDDVIYMYLNNLLYKITSNKYIISESYIDLINDYLDKIDTKDPSSEVYYKANIVINLVDILYQKNSYLYSKILYKFVDKTLDLIKDVSSKYLYYMNHAFLNTLVAFKKDFFNTDISTDVTKLNHTAIDVVLKTYNNLLSIAEYKGIKPNRILSTLESILLKFPGSYLSYYYYYGEIVNTLLSKNFSNPKIKFLIPSWCYNIIVQYYKYRRHSVNHDYTKDGKNYHIHYAQSKYDIGLVNITNLFLNKIIKDFDNRNIYQKTLYIGSRLTHVSGFDIPYDNHRLGVVGFFILNADKYEIGKIDKLVKIVSIIGDPRLVYNAICSANVVKIPSIIIDYLLPKFWGKKVTDKNLDDIFNILKNVQPEAGIKKIIERKKYIYLREKLRSYIRNI